MKKTHLLLIALASWALATAFTLPAGAIRPDSFKPLILEGANADPTVLAIFERSCQNCHSANTQWPLYGKIYPITLLLAHDVREARSHVDLSSWPKYSDEHKRLMLSEIGVVVRNGSMPPKRYTLLHPDAKLSPAEADAVYQWTRTSRKLLKQEAGE